MPHIRRRNAYEHMSDFNKGGNENYWNCYSSYCSIRARVGRDSTTVYRIWNLWTLEDYTGRSTGSQRSAVTNSEEDRHLTRRNVQPHHDLSQGIGSFARQMSAQCLKQHGLSAW